MQSQFLQPVRLHSARSLACSCSILTAIVKVHLFSPTFSVGQMDGTLDNARFVASLRLPTLGVDGEESMPVLKLSHCRSLPRLKVGTMGRVAALFLGAAIGDCDCLLRLA